MKRILFSLLFLCSICVNGYAARIDLADFSNDKITIDYEDIEFTDPNSGNGALSPILDYQSLGVVLYVHNSPGTEPIHDVFRLGGWCSSEGISIATNVGDDASIEVFFDFPVYQVGALIGVSNGALRVYDENDNMLEEFDTENVNYDPANPSLTSCDFIGIENYSGIHKAVFHDITNNGLVLSIDNLTFTPFFVISVISIDIIPKTCPNECHIKGGGSVEVAILGTVDFDVNDVDIASVRLEGVAPTRSQLKDKSSPIVPTPTDCECTNEGRDGFVDLCLKFDKKAIITALGEVNIDQEYSLSLTGNLNDGTPIEGQDCIVFVKKGKKD